MSIPKPDNSKTQSLSFGADASTARLRISTNKKWKAVVKNGPNGEVLTDTWMTVTPDAETGAALVRLTATDNPANTARSVYVEFYAEDQPYLLRQVIRVSQEGTPVAGDKKGARGRHK